MLVGACSPANLPSTQNQPLCFDKRVNELQLVQADSSQFENCRLYDYVHIFPLMGQESCDYWKQRYSQALHIHFNKIFLKGVRKIVCLKQEYLDRPGLSF